MDIAIFNFSTAQLRQTKKKRYFHIQNQEIEVVDTLLFLNSLERMSVIVEIHGRNFIYCKGSPEKIKNICKIVPPDYDQQMDYYYTKGFRMLAICYRELNKHEIEQPRDVKEANLVFLGFVLLVNQLQTDTKQTMAVLKEA